MEVAVANEILKSMEHVFEFMLSAEVVDDDKGSLVSSKDMLMVNLEDLVKGRVSHFGIGS